MDMESDAPSSISAVRCWVEGRRVWLELADQRWISFPAAKFPRLARASEEALARVRLRVGGRALRWEELDEDIWVQDVLDGRFPRPRAEALSA